MENQETILRENTEAAVVHQAGEGAGQEAPRKPESARPERPAGRPAGRPTPRPAAKPAQSSGRDKALRELIENVENERTRDYLKNRIIPQLDWYDSKSIECRQWYVRLMTASIVLGALIPIVAVFSSAGTLMKTLTAALGAGITAINAYLALHNYRDLWLTYRHTCESLLRTLYCYFNDAGLFTPNHNPIPKDTYLVNLCEEALAQETEGWLSNMKK